MKIINTYKASNHRDYAVISEALKQELIFMQEQLESCDEDKLAGNANNINFHVNELIKAIESCKKETATSSKLGAATRMKITPLGTAFYNE